MTRLAIIGNSHVACLKTGWSRMGDSRPDLKAVYFADRGDRLDGLVAKGDRLVPSNPRLKQVIAHTSGGLTEIVPADYDAILVFGLGLDPVMLPDSYSMAVLRQTVVDRARSSLNYRLVERLRAVTRLPIYVGACPLLAMRRTSPIVDRSIYPLNRTTLAEDVFSPLDATFVSQPDRTICRGFFTRSRYSEGSMRLDVADSISGQSHPSTERRHMNADYGAEMWAVLLAHLDASRGVRGGVPAGRTPRPPGGRRFFDRLRQRLAIGG